MPWFPNPFTLTHAAREARRVLSGGGPKVMRLTGVTQPEGVIFPTSAVCLEVEARDRTARQRIRRAEEGSVADVKREPGYRPPPATGDELAEQLDVIVVRAEDALVDRLLSRPGGGS
jgi:hypothetical protein